MAVNTGDERLGQWDSERTVSVPTNVGSIPDRLATIIWLVSQCQVLEGAPALRWFEANEEEFTRLREIHASYATHARSIKCLTQFLTQVIMQRDNIPITNDSRNALNVAILANNPLATALENIHNPPPTVDGLPPPPADAYDHLMRWVQDIALKVLDFIHQKCSAALVLIADFNDLKANILTLQPRLTEMRCSLITKSEVHRSIQPIVIQLGTVATRIKDYVRLGLNVEDINGINANNLMVGVVGPVHITQRVEIEALELAKDNNTLPWVYALNPAFDKPLLLLWFREESMTLDNLSHECTSYNPSPEELSAQRAKNLKEAVVEIDNQITNLRIGEEAASENKYESLIKKLDNIENLAFELRAGGIKWTVETYSISEDDFQNLKDFCHDRLNAKKKARKNVEKQEDSIVSALNRHLSLPQAEEIRDQESWLSFYTTFMKIESKIPTNEQKLQYVSERVKRSEDRANIRAFQTFDEVWQYLLRRYHNPINIVPLVREKISRLETPRDDGDMEKNLYKFMNLVATLKSISKLETLECFFIRTIVKKNLFTTNVQFIYFEKLYELEQTFKKELYEGLGGEAAGMSMADIDPDDSFDPKRRQFLLDFTEQRLEILRSSRTHIENPKGSKPKQASSALINPAEKEKCPLCSSRHKIRNSNRTASMAACKSFLEMSPKARSDYCSKNKICKVCLYPISPKHEKDKGGFCAVKRFYCNLCPQNSSSTLFKTHSKLLHWETSASSNKTDHQNQKGGNGGNSGGGGPSGGPNGKGNRKGSKGGGNQKGNKDKNQCPASTQEPGKNDKSEQDIDIVVQEKPFTQKEHKIDEHPSLKSTIELLNLTTSMVQNVADQACRFYFQCAFNVKIATPNGRHEQICLSDTGSTLSFACEKDMGKIKVPAQGQWKGTLRTLAGLTEITCPFFSIPLVLTDGQIREIIALGT